MDHVYLAPHLAANGSRAFLPRGHVSDNETGGDPAACHEQVSRSLMPMRIPGGSYIGNTHTLSYSRMDITQKIT
jgi:hypothetical protein